MTAKKSDMTAEDCLRAAWQSLLRGDLAGRDAMVAQTEKAMGDRRSIPADEVVLAAHGPVELIEQPDGTYAPRFSFVVLQ